MVTLQTREKLLFDFLDELIFLMDTEFVILSEFQVKIKNNKLECTARGDYAQNYTTHGDIKAPTYNEMSIKETDNGFVLRVVVDI